MEELIQQITQYFEAFMEFAREGYREVDAGLGLVIALVATFMMSSYGRILFMSLGSTIAHLVAEVLIPVIANNRDLKLPPFLESEYWRYAAVLFVGYFFVITLLYILRRVLLRR